MTTVFTLDEARKLRASCEQLAYRGPAIASSRVNASPRLSSHARQRDATPVAADFGNKVAVRCMGAPS
jgi:hypothetical protein